MKANLKGSNAFVRFLLGHGEKVGMAGILICAGLLIWSAIGHDRLGSESSSEKLEKKAVDAKTHVASFRWDKLEEEDKKIATPVSGGAMKPVQSSYFPPFAYNFDRRVLDPVGLRTDPILLTLENLEVHGDSGLWASADPAVVEQKRLEAIKEEKQLAKEKEAERKRTSKKEDKKRGAGGGRGANIFGARGGAPPGREKKKTAKDVPIVVQSRTGATLQGYEDITARSWVTVLAKVPVKQQYQHYRDALGSARGYQEAHDAPNYLGYRVERAEVTDQGQGKWVRVATVVKTVLRKEIAKYPVNTPDVIDPRHKHPILTHPLPPLILREWDERATHSSMPLPSQLNFREQQDAESEGEIEETGDEDDLFASSTARNKRGESFGPRGLPGGPGSRRFPGGRSPFGDGFGRGGPGGKMAMEEGYGGPTGFAPPGGVGLRGAELGAYIWDHETSHVLFRYFDRTVKPGHRYRYRVRLALTDVNDNVSEKYLDKEVTERRKKEKNPRYRFTAWSEPSPIASVPLPARIYLVGVKPAKESNFNSEPEAELLVKVLNSEHAAEIARTEWFGRGNVINMHDKATVIWTSQRDTDETSEFDFRSGITLLDFTGGEKLSKKDRDLTAPTRAILMDLAGRLMLHSELDDSEPVAEFRQIVEDGKGANRGGRQPFGGPGGPGIFGPEALEEDD